MLIHINRKRVVWFKFDPLIKGMRWLINITPSFSHMENFQTHFPFILFFKLKDDFFLPPTHSLHYIPKPKNKKFILF